MLWKLLAAAAAGFLLTAICGYFLLPILKKRKIGQSIREDAVPEHIRKAGTPTMGGLMFIPALLLVCIFLPEKNAAVGLWLYCFLAYALIGFLDDRSKLLHKQNQGLTAKQKLAGQFAAVAILLLMHAYMDPHPTAIYLFSDQIWLDLGWWYYPLIAVLMAGMVNAVNLTDGLDGLAAGVSIPVFLGFMVALVINQVWGLSYIAAALVGCCGAFLLYNHYPARLFMGDTGSMALGGAVVGLAVAGDMEVLMIGFGLVYLLEALSVMLQVASCQLSKRFLHEDKRLFLKAPIHHHFQELGRKETEVTAIFTLASAVFVFLTLLLFVTI